ARLDRGRLSTRTVDRSPRTLREPRRVLDRPERAALTSHGGDSFASGLDDASTTRVLESHRRSTDIRNAAPFFPSRVSTRPELCEPHRSARASSSSAANPPAEYRQR